LINSKAGDLLVKQPMNLIFVVEVVPDTRKRVGDVDEFGEGVER